MDNIKQVISLDPEISKLIAGKRIARNYQLRRHEEWNDNYELYRNKVRTNRLTQRQAVNIPLMKETIKTLQSKIDEIPSVDFKEKGGDQLKDIIIKEKWENDFRRLNMEAVDLQDKKTVLLYGRGFKKLNFIDGKFGIYAPDIYDIVIDPLVSPIDIETARYIVNQNIFRTLQEILADKRYTKEARAKLDHFYSTKDMIIQSSENAEELKRKQDRLVAMGVNESDLPKFSAGDVIVNLTEHYVNMWDEKAEKFVRYVYVYADDNVILMKEKLSDLIGVEFWPFVTWGEDIETQDFWSDSPADLVRTPNKVLNVWFSQMTENRTLRNFQMHWYDATKQGYVPQTYEPGPGRMLPAPGNPKDTIMPVEVSGLDDCINQINFVIGLVERGTAATATEKGEIHPQKTTLGEVELAVGKAMERTLTMAKFYRRSWEELANKWYKLQEANASGKEALYKKSSKGNMYALEVGTKDWISKKGYDITVQSSSEQESEKTRGIQRLVYLKSQFPNNPVLNRIVQRRSLELVDLSHEEMKEIEEYEDKMMAQPMPVQPVQQAAPVRPQSPVMV